MLIRKNSYGFTLIEMLVVVAMIGILAAIAVPNYLKAKDKAKEAEVRANLHVIQTALERYATDHIGEYPKYILGGDDQGWRKCDAIVNRDPLLRPPKDPLMEYGYIVGYPKNPFIEDGLTDIIDNTGNPDNLRYGGGDVRFGYDGSTMGNTLDDPRYLWIEPGILSHMQYTFATDSYFAANNSLEGDYINPFYTMGGLPDRNGFGIEDRKGRTMKAFWPGQFFYRSTGTILLRSELDARNIEKIWDVTYTSHNRYMLGCYGATRTAGDDIIRMTDITGEAINNVDGQDSPSVYSPNGLFGNNVDNNGSPPIPFASPEVFGGGRMGVMPIFPYYKMEDQAPVYVYGAPDGYNDGVIMVYTSEDDAKEQY